MVAAIAACAAVVVAAALIVARLRSKRTEKRVTPAARAVTSPRQVFTSIAGVMLPELARTPVPARGNSTAAASAQDSSDESDAEGAGDHSPVVAVAPARATNDGGMVLIGGVNVAQVVTAPRASKSRSRPRRLHSATASANASPTATSGSTDSDAAAPSQSPPVRVRRTITRRNGSGHKARKPLHPMGVFDGEQHDLDASAGGEDVTVSLSLDGVGASGPVTTVSQDSAASAPEADVMSV